MRTIPVEEHLAEARKDENTHLACALLVLKSALDKGPDYVTRDGKFTITLDFSR